MNNEINNQNGINTQSQPNINPGQPNPATQGIPSQMPNNVRPTMPNPGIQGQPNMNHAQPNTATQGVPNQMPNTVRPTMPNPGVQGQPNMNPGQPNPTTQGVPNQMPNNVRHPMPNPGVQGQPNMNPGQPNPATQGIPNQMPNNVRPPMPNPGVQGRPNMNPGQPNPIQSIEQQTGIPTNTATATAQPQVAANVEPIITEEPKVEENKQDEIAPSVIEDKLDDTASITFDYNALYGVNNTTETNSNETQSTANDRPLFTESEVVISTPSFEDRTKTDITPEFNINALEGKNEEKNNSINNVLTDKEQDRADTRRRIIFIGVIVLILVIFVGFIFPIISGYK